MLSLLQLSVQCNLLCYYSLCNAILELAIDAFILSINCAFAHLNPDELCDPWTVIMMLCKMYCFSEHELYICHCRLFEAQFPSSILSHTFGLGPIGISRCEFSTELQCDACTCARNMQHVCCRFHQYVDLCDALSIILSMFLIMVDISAYI